MFLDVSDEYAGTIAPWGRLDFALPRISVRELIAARVRLELERLAESREADRRALTLSETEKRLNGAVRPSPLAALLADGDRRQVARAEEAFVQGRYFVLFGDRQAESLDEQVDLARTSEVTFLLLTPLKGG